jgi:hypothetical protein
MQSVYPILASAAELLVFVAGAVAMILAACLIP